MKNIDYKDIGIVILAAGQGKRLGYNGCPKVLYKIGGRPIISYILDVLDKGGIKKEQISIVVGFEAEQVKQACGEGYAYAFQEERLGTAHAAYTGEQVLADNINTILVMNGDDSAFYKFESISNFIDEHINNSCDLSLLSLNVDDPISLGRVLRDEQDNFIGIVEKENMKEVHQSIREISTGTFCFRRAWFKEHYKNLKPIPSLNEYGLPSFIGEAVKLNSTYQAVLLKNRNEWFGINTKEELEYANKLLA